MFQVSKTGQVLLSEIVGSVKMRVRLTGMPELRLGLNDKVLFDNTNSKILYHCPCGLVLNVLGLPLCVCVCVCVLPQGPGPKLWSLKMSSSTSA